MSFFYADHTSVIDALIDQQRAEVDPSRRTKVLRELQRRVYEDAPYIPLYQQNDIFGVNKRVQWIAVIGGHLFLRTAQVKA